MSSFRQLLLIPVPNPESNKKLLSGFKVRIKLIAQHDSHASFFNGGFCVRDGLQKDTQHPNMHFFVEVTCINGLRPLTFTFSFKKTKKNSRRAVSVSQDMLFSCIPTLTGILGSVLARWGRLKGSRGGHPTTTSSLLFHFCLPSFWGASRLAAGVEMRK